MRKHLLPLTALAATAALALAACSGSTDSDATASGDSTAGLQTLVVGATAVPAGEIVQYIIDSGQAAAAGLDIQITEFSDYNTPNPALSEGATDVNLFQHKPFLDLYNENSGDDLVSVGEVYLPPLALYSKKVDSLDALPEGASIALPNDGSNESRALLLLQSAGLIEVADGGSTVADITSNPHGYQFLEVDAASLPAALDDQDAAIVNFSFASAAGLSSDLQLLSEGTDSPYFNILATRAELADDARVLAFYDLLTSAETQQWIEDEYNGLVVPAAVS
ncbi:MetQ/NlpA family ABC transporter substrate-binding protein [Demequina capsici]|uniref:Lipoprotein n=1 Tax=Demequina capsici TaxID=3075620 RepID=A0AA96JGM8_9MICO|nr:MetQ/NlpA family ABC transporter substrate-binding protein [Demequina sp. PMTSA13]WNM28124.1 MetQ/NlpA family ABC transporter substrate-binding protein [Demequina sp. PMTSA13]